jgi:D-alanyl-D-alanine dipeptidase
MPLRVLAARLLFRLGARNVLPREAIAAVSIRDCGEELVPIEPTPRLYLAPMPKERILLARTGVVLRLLAAANALPPGNTLLVVDAFRSRTEQSERWRIRLAEIASSFPLESDTEIERRARRLTAPPTGRSGGHQTGGALDVTLGDCEGCPLEMGTPVKARSWATPTRAPGLPVDVRERRAVLQIAMEGSGFVNYPLEWWHFSFGDSLWAAYSRLRQAIYGEA